MIVHIVYIKVLVCVVPAHNVKEVVIIEDIVRERAYLWQTWITLHEIFLHVEAEAFVRSHSLVKATEDQNGLTVDWHAHGQVAGRPGRLGVQVDHAPHVMIDVVHLDRIRDLLLIELGSTTKYIDILVVENAACSGVSRHIQICDPAPSVILNIVLFARCVETLCIVATDHENQPALRIKSREI